MKKKNMNNTRGCFFFFLCVLKNVVFFFLFALDKWVLIKLLFLFYFCNDALHLI